jgi:hypothetical protein
MYFLRDDTSPNDLLWEDIDVNGVIGEKKDSPLHTSSGFKHPIRVNLDGSIALLGSVVIHNGQTSERLDIVLPNEISDAAFVETAAQFETLPVLLSFRIWLSLHFLWEKFSEFQEPPRICLRGVTIRLSSAS